MHRWISGLMDRIAGTPRPTEVELEKRVAALQIRCNNYLLDARARTVEIAKLQIQVDGLFDLRRIMNGHVDGLNGKLAASEKEKVVLAADHLRALAELDGRDAMIVKLAQIVRETTEDIALNGGYDLGNDPRLHEIAKVIIAAEALVGPVPYLDDATS